VIIIYLCTNKKNGKRYVGQTTMTLDQRWTQHCTRDGNSAFSRAVRRYGANAWTVRQLEVCKTRRAAHIAEAAWILHYGTLVPDGYNVRRGNFVAARRQAPANARITEKWIRCGRNNCDQCPHGPYLYAKWSENGKTVSKYLGKP
jgi:group I intron endonuclease